jgi:hypothetical protein
VVLGMRSLVDDSMVQHRVLWLTNVRFAVSSIITWHVLYFLFDGLTNCCAFNLNVEKGKNVIWELACLCVIR